MTKRLSTVGLGALLLACSGSGGGGSGGGSGSAGGGSGGSGGGAASCSGPISCNQPSDHLCDEYPAPTATQCADLPSSCANRSGTYAKPAACPSAGFKGKCTIPGGLVTRFYDPRGDSTDQSFCTGTAGGAWSTTF